MEYGKGHFVILDDQTLVPPYDWEQEHDLGLAAERVAPVIPIHHAPSLERVAVSNTVTLIRPRLDTKADPI